MINDAKYVIGSVSTKAGNIPLIRGNMTLSDKLGTLMVRLSINRNNYKVLPGLYAIGNPSGSSDVFVTANYKLSFDHLRKNIQDFSAWILVLDTKGINVWCAAGKGTFGTRELVNRIKLTRLSEIVGHRRIILPQLGAAGVSAYEVKKQTAASGNSGLLQQKANDHKFALTPAISDLKVEKGFDVVYGPVKARYIRQFISNKYHATPEMRKVTFTLAERATLIPVDLINGRYPLVIAGIVLLALSGLSREGYSLQLFQHNGIHSVVNVLLAYIAGIVITPLALPWLPGRSFSFKGFVAGALVFVLALILGYASGNYFEISSWFLIMVSISSFMAMNFTGSSTFTSLSGVKKEMKIAVPLQIICSAAGLVLLIIGRLCLSI